MTLRNSINERKKVQEVFSKYNGTTNVGENSFIKKSVLTSALCDAMGKSASQELIDRSIATIDASDKDTSSNPFHKEDIGFHEFILLMQYLRQQMEVPDAQIDENGSNGISLISNEKKVKLLNSLSNDLYPLRKLLRIQIDRQDANIIPNEKSHHDDNFVAAYAPDQMLILALVSHNQMKATAKRFVRANKNIIKKFRLTGTNSTMEMLKDVFDGDSDVCYGPSCSSGPLGGDAELAALLTQGKLGAIIFFQDPMDAHPHQADILCLCRLALVYNKPIAHNPTTALMMLNVFRAALKGEGKPELIPSFFFSLMSPSVPAYKAAQQKVIQSFANEDRMSDDKSAESPMRRSAIARAIPQDSLKEKCRDKDNVCARNVNKHGSCVDAASPAPKILDNSLEWNVRSPRCVKEVIFPSEISITRSDVFFNSTTLGGHDKISCPFDEVSCPTDEDSERVPVSSKTVGKKIHYRQPIGTESFLSKDNKIASSVAENEEDLLNYSPVFFDESRHRLGVGTESFLSKDNKYSSSNIAENEEDLLNYSPVFFDESRHRLEVGTESFLSKDSKCSSSNIAENEEDLLNYSPILFDESRHRLGVGTESFLSKDNQYSSNIAENEEDLLGSSPVFFDESSHHLWVGTESFLSKNNQYSSNIAENEEDLLGSSPVSFGESRHRLGVGTESFLSKDNKCSSSNIAKNEEDLLNYSPVSFGESRNRLGVGTESFLSKDNKYSSNIAENGEELIESFRTADTSQSSFISKINSSKYCDPIGKKQNIRQNEKAKKIKNFFRKKNKMSSNSLSPYSHLPR